MCDNEKLTSDPVEIKQVFLLEHYDMKLELLDREIRQLCQRIANHQVDLLYARDRPLWYWIRLKWQMWRYKRNYKDMKFD